MATTCNSEALVLIDGYNLYHSLLEIEKDHDHKVRWLDVKKLSERLLERLFPKQCPYQHVFFFTAYPHYKGTEHVDRQKAYHQCLKRRSVKIVTDGDWTKKEVDLKFHMNGQPRLVRWFLMRRFRQIETYIEKGTDVSIASHLMHLGPKAKWVCLISGDADLMPAIRLFRDEYPAVQFGLARPYKRETRKMNMKNCTNILPEDCLECLLPNPAPTKKRDVSKPAHW